MHRSIIESLLGIRRKGDVLVISPHLQSGWPGFRFVERFGRSHYRINVRASQTSDVVPPSRIALIDDGEAHVIDIEATGDFAAATERRRIEAPDPD